MFSCRSERFNGFLLKCDVFSGLLFAFLFGSIMSLSFNRLILWTLKTWPECFTFGEAALAVEAAIIFFSSVVTSPLFSSDSASCVDVSTKILQVLVYSHTTICYLDLSLNDNVYIIYWTFLCYTLSYIHFYKKTKSILQIYYLRVMITITYLILIDEGSGLGC